MEASTGLIDVPVDALSHVFYKLAPRDLAALACTSKLLRAIVNAQDAVWRHQVERWLRAQRSNGIATPTAHGLLSALRLPSHRLLCQALHRLGSWPVGVWHATDAFPLPRGRLLVVQLDPSAGGLLLQVPSPARLAGPTEPAAAWELGNIARLSVVRGGGEAQAGWALSSSDGQLAAVQLAPDGQGLQLHPGPRLNLAHLPGWRTFSAPATSASASGGSGGVGEAATALSSLARYLGIGTARISQQSVSYQRAALPSPADQQPVEGEPPGMELLRRCQGLFYGSYGPHGLEVLSLRASAAEDDVPPLCPIIGPRLQALKLLGDPNVPAHKFSFVVDGDSCRLGPYDPETDDPFAPEGGGARPCFAFHQMGTTVLHLEQRPVKARFRAVGQINRVPGTWAPEWTPATFLLYDAPIDRLATIVFEDEDEPFRHGIDFAELPYVPAA